MRNRFENKVAVVTGGNSGIGLATAKAYAREGARVAITGRDAATLASAAAEIGPETLAIRADSASVPEVAQAMARIGDRFGRIDALLVNAAVGRFVPFDEVTEALFDDIMSANLKGAFFTVQKASPYFSRGAAVVLNASINAHKGLPGSTVYGASKAAVVNLAKTLSADLLPRGVRVNAISPGPVDTPMFGRLGQTEEQVEQTRAWMVDKVPLKRLGRPEEIADAVLYLTSDESRFVVGTELVVDGGLVPL